MTPPPPVTDTKPPLLWGHFGAFILFECALPASPLIMEYFIYGVLKLSEFTLFEKGLVASAMTVAMVAFLKSQNVGARVGFGFVTFFSVFMLGVVLTLNASAVSIAPAARERALAICYQASLWQLIGIITVLFFMNLVNCIVAPAVRRIA